jgi:hypothetical protein
MGRHIPILLLLLLVAATTVAEAHSGGLDRCGGHNDRKRGGYHVHNLARYCGCYPEAESCQPAKSQEPASPGPATPTPPPRSVAPPAPRPR